MLRTAHQADTALRERMIKARANTHYTKAIPDHLKPVVQSLIRKGESKKKICILFSITYEQLKAELSQPNAGVAK